jgi:glycosyltransferase involved in cell wall biosynthesis
MIKVLHLRDTDKLCGPGKTILETASRIDQSRFKLSVGLFLRSHEDSNYYREMLESRGIEVIPIVAKSQFSIEMMKTMIGIIRDNNFDIIHAHDYKTDILTTLISRSIQIPTMTTAHGWITNTTKSKLYTFVGKNCFRFFDKVIAVSPKIQKTISSFGVRADRLELIYNAIVAENYIRDNYAPGYLRQRFDIPAHYKIIGNVGRISPEKGQKDFVRAAAKLLQRREDLAFILIGNGPDAEEVKSLADELKIGKSVFFTGHEEEIRPVYRDLDLFALTSYTEGFPNVVLESLCMDIPVLATDVGGTADIVSNLETGMLVEAGKVEQIVEGLSYLLDNPEHATKMVDNGKQKIMANYEFAIRVQKIEALYESMVSKNRLGRA